MTGLTNSDQLSKMLNLKNVSAANRSITTIPTREDLTYIISLPRHEFLSEVKLLINKQEYWQQKVEGSKAENGVVDQEAYRNHWDISSALNGIQESLEKYSGLRKKRFNGRTIKRVVNSGLTGMIATGVVFAIAIPLKVYSDRESRRKSYIASFEEALGQKSLKETTRIAKEAKQSELFNDEWENWFETSAYNITEEGRFKKLDNSTGNQVVSSAKKYLENYPEGEHRSEVLRRMVTAQTASLARSLGKNGTYTEALKQIRSLQSTLREYENTGDLTVQLSSSDINKAATEFIDTVKWVHDPEASIFNSVVRANATTPREGNWFTTYFADRSTTFPNGSTGRVIGRYEENDRNYIAVDFPQQEHYDWRTTDWKYDKQFWNGKDKSAACFRESELQAVSKVTDIQKKVFVEEVDKLYNLLKSHSK